MSEVINKKEKLLLEALLSDRACFVKCFRILKPSYFEPPLDEAVSFVIEHFKKYHQIPDMDVIDAEVNVKLKEREVDPEDHQYLLDEIEELCQEKAMTEAILKSVDLINDGNKHGVSELVREALMVKLDSSVGMDLFEDPLNRIEGMDQDVEERKIGIAAIDDLAGNIRRGELGLFIASTSGGKSVALANVANRLGKQKLDVLIISLELREELYSKRLDAILTGKDIGEHKLLAAEIAEALEALKPDYGRIVTKKMRFGTTPSQIRTVVMEYSLLYGKAPDVLIVDYLGLMGADSTSVRKGMNKFDEDELKVFGLKDIIDEYNMYGFSAGQLNRDGYDVIQLSPKHVAGGISVINACDWAIGLVATDEDIDNNQTQAVQMKIRSGAKTTSIKTIYRCPKTLVLSDQPSIGKNAKSPIVDRKGKSSSDEGDSKPMSTKKRLNSALEIGRKKR